MPARRSAGRWPGRCPVPSNSSARCSRWKTPNSLCAYCMSNPTPLSRTNRMARPASSPAQPISIRAGSRIRLYLMALSMRLVSTCLSRTASPMTVGRAAICQTIARPLVAISSARMTSCTSSSRSIDDADDLGPAHAGEGQQVVDQLAHLLARVGDRLQVMPGLLRQLAVGRPLQHLDVAVDVPQRRAQIVRHRVAEGFQFLVDIASSAACGVSSRWISFCSARARSASARSCRAPRKHALQVPADRGRSWRCTTPRFRPSGARGELVVGDLAFAGRG